MCHFETKSKVTDLTVNTVAGLGITTGWRTHNINLLHSNSSVIYQNDIEGEKKSNMYRMLVC
jgi:hypothetical protein